MDGVWAWVLLLGYMGTDAVCCPSIADSDSTRANINDNPQFYFSKGPASTTTAYGTVNMNTHNVSRQDR